MNRQQRRQQTKAAKRNARAREKLGKNLAARQRRREGLDDVPRIVATDAHGHREVFLGEMVQPDEQPVGTTEGGSGVAQRQSGLLVVHDPIQHP